MTLPRRGVLAVAALALLPRAAGAATVPTITTVAGSVGTGPGTSVAMNVVALAIRGSTLYAADPWWHVVRRIDARTGRVSTLAGNGSAATYGDGGGALVAGVGQPSSVAVAADGSVYLGQEEGLVRRVGADGRVTTVAGGGAEAEPLLPTPARSVRLGPVDGLSFTTDGDLLIADGNMVRRMTPDRLVTTVAGTAEAGYAGDGGPARLAKLNHVAEVVESPDGSVYVADELNNRVRRISPLGLISTYAGDGTRGDRPSNISTGDGGPAVAARVTFPDALAFDATGALLVGAAGSVRRVDATGVISTWVRGVDGEALAVGADRSTYVASSRVTRRDANGRTTVLAGRLGLEAGDGGPARTAQLMDPRSVAVVAGGLLVGDGTTDHVRLVDARGRIRTYLDFPAERDVIPFDPQDLFRETTKLDNFAVDRDGTVYVLDEFFGMAFRWHGSGSMRQVVGSTTADSSCFGRRGGDGGAATKAGLCMPEDIAVRDGRLLIADTMASRVRLVDAHGRITTVAGSYAGNPPGPGPDFGSGFSGDGGPATKARLDSPAAVAWGPGGSFVVADTGNGRIRQVDAHGRIRTLAEVDGAVDLAVTARGTVYVLDRLGRVLRLDGSRGVVVAGIGQPGWSGDGGDARQARIGAATGIALSRDERVLYVADPSSHRVRAVRLA